MDGDALFAGRGIDLSAVFRTSQPTRDVLVTRSLDGDRTFAGFGKAKANGVVFNAFQVTMHASCLALLCNDFIASHATLACPTAK